MCEKKTYYKYLGLIYGCNIAEDEFLVWEEFLIVSIMEKTNNHVTNHFAEGSIQKNYFCQSDEHYRKYSELFER